MIFPVSLPYHPKLGVTSASSCPLSSFGWDKFKTAFGHWLFVLYIAIEIVGYNLGLLGTLDATRQSWIVRFLTLGVLYFWSVCLPLALRMLFNRSRFQKFGLSGVIHILTCVFSTILGLVLLVKDFVLHDPVQPGHPIILAQGILGCVSMASSWMMFHILPRLSKKLFRLFFVGSMITFNSSSSQILLHLNYQKHVLHQDAPKWLEAVVAVLHFKPLVMTACSITLVAALVNSADAIMELLDKILPVSHGVEEIKATGRRARPLQGQQKGRIMGTARLVVQSYTQSDIMNKVFGRPSTSNYTNADAHKCVQVDWPQVFNAGTELSFAWMQFLIGYSAFAQGDQSSLATFSQLFYNDHATIALNGSAGAKDYASYHTLAAASYVFYAGMIFPLSVVFKGKMKAQDARFLSLLYALSAGSLSSFVSASAAVFYQVIAVNFALLLVGILFRRLASETPVSHKEQGQD